MTFFRGRSKSSYIPSAENIQPTKVPCLGVAYPEHPQRPFPHQNPVRRAVLGREGQQGKGSCLGQGRWGWEQGILEEPRGSRGTREGSSSKQAKRERRMISVSVREDVEGRRGCEKALSMLGSAAAVRRGVQASPAGKHTGEVAAGQEPATARGGARIRRARPAAARKSPPSSAKAGWTQCPVRPLRPSEIVQREGGRVGSWQRLSPAPARSTGLLADSARNKYPAVTEPRHGCFSSKQPHFTSPELT